MFIVVSSRPILFLQALAARLSNSRRSLLLILALALTSWFGTGCSPNGPRALEQGEAALNQGYYPEAIRILTIAVDKLPREARAWNLLGLAYHGNHQPELASQAYSKALALDHRLSAARYNLGVLLLESNQLQPAVNELTAFTLLQPRNIDGWLHLASAHLRLNKPEAADTCYRTILNLQPKHPEALNGLGMISVQRRRYVDAIQFFQAALSDNPSYAPALLNQAIVIHRNLNQRATALQKYRQYLALQPRPENWEAVNQLAQNLADELYITNRVATVASTPPTAVPATNRTALTANPTAASPNSIAPRTNVVLTPRTPTPTPTPRTTTAPSQPASVARIPIPVPSPNPVQPQPVRPQLPPTPPPTPTTAATATTAQPAPAPEPPPPAIVVAELPRTLELPPARDVAPAVLDAPPATAPSAASPNSNRDVPLSAASGATQPAPAPATSSPASSEPKPDERRGFFSRLNPFRSSKSKTENPSTTTPTASPTPAPRVVTAAPTPPPAPIASPRTQVASATPTAPSGNFPRYNYLNLPKPRPGDRQKAAMLVNKGIEAHNSRELEEEIGFYRSATLTDPSSYDAYFNLGLASAERGDWSAALEAYEHALSIDGDSLNSRYNFAVALRQSGYPVDAAGQLEQILKVNPNEPKALLALGNLHAQRFNQPKAARQYYQRLLDVAPNHPKASEIRFWLAANP